MSCSACADTYSPKPIANAPANTCANAMAMNEPMGRLLAQRTRQQGEGSRDAIQTAENHRFCELAAVHEGGLVVLALLRVVAHVIAVLYAARVAAAAVTAGALARSLLLSQLVLQVLLVCSAARLRVAVDVRRTRGVGARLVQVLAAIISISILSLTVGHVRSLHVESGHTAALELVDTGVVAKSGRVVRRVVARVVLTGARLE